MNNEAKESAVSEVVGVILMVALTVIMAAIIGAYMFGLMDSRGLTPHILAVSAQQATPSTLEVRYMGGPDYKSLENLTITWPTGARQLIDSPKIGDVYTATNVNPPPYNATPGAYDHIIVVGHFNMGAGQVVLDTRV
jgi:archaeal type IV pilus assembly protein PilA